MKLYKTKITQPVKCAGKKCYYPEKVCITGLITNFDIPEDVPALKLYKENGNLLEGSYRTVIFLIQNSNSKKLKKALLQEYAEYLI